MGSLHSVLASRKASDFLHTNSVREAAFIVTEYAACYRAGGCKRGRDTELSGEHSEISSVICRGNQHLSATRELMPGTDSSFLKDDGNHLIHRTHWRWLSFIISLLPPPRSLPLPTSSPHSDTGSPVAQASFTLLILYLPSTRITGIHSSPGLWILSKAFKMWRTLVFVFWDFFLVI